MCVIFTKLEEQPLFPFKLIDDAMEANPHGAGYMFYHDGKVHIKKGFDKPWDILRAMRDDKLDDCRVVFHARIATHGDKSKVNCHPFPVTNKLTEFHEAEFSCDMGVAHNGIIPIARDLEAYSDTIHFIKSILSLDTIKGQMDSADIRRFITEYIGGSKLAVLMNDGTLWYFGHWMKTPEGYAASNLSYQFVGANWRYNWQKLGTGHDYKRKEDTEFYRGAGADVQIWDRIRNRYIKRSDIVSQVWDKKEGAFLYTLKEDSEAEKEV